MSKRTIQCPHNMDINKCPEHWAEFQAITAPVSATDKLREEIAQMKFSGFGQVLIQLSDKELDSVMALIESNSKELLDRVERDVIGKNVKPSEVQPRITFKSVAINDTKDDARTKLNQLRKQEGLK